MLPSLEREFSLAQHLSSTNLIQYSYYTTIRQENKMTSRSTTSSPSSSEQLISNIIREGSERGIIYASAGLVVGGLASIVLARGGGAGGARKAITMFGAGVGTGAAWTRCSVDIENATKNMN